MKQLLPLLALLPSLLFAQTVWNGTANTTWYTNDENATEFTITTAEQLAGLAQLVNGGDSMSGKTIKLGNDIALNDTTDWKNWGDGDSTRLNQWTAIGGFKGTFDGDGHTVRGVYIIINSYNRSGQGFFGRVEYYGTIKNLGVIASYIKGSNACDNIGGLVGILSGAITNSYATGNVSGGDYVGGLVGFNECSGNCIRDSYATGNVSGGNYVGGLAGSKDGGGTITNIYATGNVSGNANVGGLMGSSGGFISNSYSTGNVSGTSNYVGGLVGSYGGGPAITISNSYSTGNVSGTSNYVGGLVGFINYLGGTVTNSYYDRETSRRSDTGKGDGKYTAEMKDSTTYADWDFDNIWYIGPNINNGLPHLISGIFPKIDTLKTDYREGLTLAGVSLPDGYQWTVPNTTPLSAGTWQFEAIHAISKGTVNVYVAKADPAVPATPTDLTATYGQTLADVELLNGWSWIDASASVGNAGTQTHQAKFMPTDTANYNVMAGMINITVAQAAGSFVTPGPITTTYAPTLKLGDLALEPGYAWNDPATTLAVGDGQTFPATYTDPSGNYTSVQSTITVNVAPASYPTFADVPAINAEFAENLTLADLEALPSGYSWTNPKTPIQYIGGHEHEAIYTNPNYLQAAAGTVTVNVSKNPGPEPEFPAISVNATFRENLTLAGIPLPSGYAWAEPSTEIPSPSDGHQFSAIHANNYYAQPSTGIIIVNASAGAGVVAIDSWSFGEKPNTPLTETITNGAAALLYTGKTNSGTSYSSAQPPSEAGRYTLTATFAAKDGSGEIVRTAEFTIEKSEGTGAVRIDGWKSGSEASNPLVESETNGIENVSYIYRSTDGTSYAPQPSKPSNPGNYILIAIFPETNNYTEARDTTYFTISKPDAIELTVNWSDNGVFTYNKMVPRPVPTVDHNGIQIPLIVLKTRSDAGEYKGVTEAIAMIADENLRTNYILQNSTKSYTVEKKALVPRFTVKNPIDEFDAKEDTIWVPRSIFSNPALLSSILAELIDYEGFARDTVKNESDNASVLSGTPRVELVYENPVSPSALYRRVETTRKATAIIVTEDVSAKNYELIKTNVTIVETVEEEDGTQQVSCSVNSSCAPMSGNSCSAIGGEAFASCTMRCSVGSACAPMPVSSCAIMEGEIVDSCPGEPSEPNEPGEPIEPPSEPIESIHKPQFSAAPFRVWQTASGMVNVDLGYTPAAPVALRVYDLKGKLVASERVSTRFASVMVKVPSGVYLFRVGGRNAVAML